MWRVVTSVHACTRRGVGVQVEIGEGFIIGQERTITSVSGHYEPPLRRDAAAAAASGHSYTKSTVFVYGTDCYLVSSMLGTLSVNVHVEPNTVVVIVWS
jgi:hypothetical protein